MSQDCHGTHRFHVADCAIVEAEGKVVVISLCINCGEVAAEHIKVTDNSSSKFTLEKEKTHELI